MTDAPALCALVWKSACGGWERAGHQGTDTADFVLGCKPVAWGTGCWWELLVGVQLTRLNGRKCKVRWVLRGRGRCANVLRVFGTRRQCCVVT